MTTPYILPLSSIRTTDLPLVGGKGANLGELTGLGMRVPDGFCLTAAAFRRFTAACPDAGHLYDLLDSLKGDDLPALRQAGEKVRRTLLQTSIPDEIARATLNAWRETGTQYAYAVRSSATAEDLPEASFAGQQETYLNVIGADALLDAVRRCWVSLFTDRAIIYRIQQGFNHREVALAVVVQQMVMAHKSGTLFSADPVTGHRHTLTIDASFGLGEALVSGLVTPDTYRVDKRSYKIISRQVASKQLAIFPQPAGGTSKVALPPAMQNQPALDDPEILTLSQLGSRIEAHYHQPMDIEWAIGTPLEASSVPPQAEDFLRAATPERQIYLLQARPITSLYPIDGLTSADGSLRIYFNMGYQQGMTQAMAPLSRSSVPLLLPIEKEQDGFSTPYLRASGGRLFADVTSFLRHPVIRKLVFALTSHFDALAPQMLKAVMRHPEFKKARPAHLSLRFLRALPPIMLRLFGALWLKDLTGTAERTNLMIDAFVAEVRSSFQAVPPGKAQLDTVRKTLPTLFPFFINWVPEAAAGIAATRLLSRFGKRYLPAEEAEALTLGVPHNVVNEMNLAIADLADLARQSPALVQHFASLGEDAHAWLAQAKTIPDAQPFLKAWDAFLNQYGARGPAEIDIMQPRWLEDPLPVLRVIAGHLQGESRSQRAEWEASLRKREAAYRKLLQVAARGPLGWLRVRLFRRWYHVMINTGGMREHHKFLAIRVLWEVKKVIRQTAKLLTERGILTNEEDIWFLEWRELMQIWDAPVADLQARVSQRRAALERDRKLTPPIIITSDGETPLIQYATTDLPPNALPGNPVSSGVVSGIAHVVRDPQKETLRKGEILVAEFTDPGWTPLFINAAGLVLEVGGALTHGAVVAREYGIPAVVGVRGATRLIRNGQRLRVDGNRGIVELLED